jgi:molecular chaperone GrpE
MEKEREAADSEAVVEELDASGVPTTGEELSADGENAPGQEDLLLKLEDARSKADENWNQLVRSRAEIENLHRRHQRELENAHKFALERFVNELLPVRDSLELGLGAAREEGAAADKLLEGMELTLKLLADAMGKFNVEQIDPQGEPFNPELHQAMSIQPRDDVPPNTVVAVVQKGYTLNQRLVRPAMVMVAQGGGGQVDEQA